jgi:uncharacterized protein (TIGR03086 family)
MSEVSERYAAIADGCTVRIVNIPSDAWSAQSPCTDWTAGDVVVHVVNTHHRVLSMLTGSDPLVVDFGNDLPARWSEATGSILGALNDGTGASTMVSSSFGEQTFESLVGRLLCTDTLVHTWDLARATGQDERLDAQGVARAMEFLAPVDESIRRPGGFGTKIVPAADADDQTKFLNFCGRAV